MLHKFTKFLVLFTVITFISCSNSESESVSLSATQFIDKSYGSDSKQSYDIYLPENRTTNTPVIIMIHGGFWSGGDKADMNSFVAIAKNTSPDYAIVNMNYRLAKTGSDKHPTQINDITSLVNELKAKQNEYQISSNFYLLGYSAGGHLALLYAYEKDTNRNIKAVCSFAGPTDFLDPSYVNSTNTQFQTVAEFFLGDTYTNNPNLYASASPITHVDSNDAPTILFYGGKDDLIPTTQATRLKAKLDTQGVAVEYNYYMDAGHDLTGIDLNDASSRIRSFFNTHK